MRQPDFLLTGHDPEDPSPWLALFLDESVPLHPEVKKAWLTDSSSWSRQYLLPFVRPLAKIAIVVVQILKVFLPRRLRASAPLHLLLAWALDRFATPEANFLILRHFHAGAENLGWLNENLANNAVPVDSLRPVAIADLKDNLFVRHDINLYNFIIYLNRYLKESGKTIEPQRCRFDAISTEGDFPVRLADMPRRRTNVIDLHTCIEIFTPVYQLFLTDSDFWRATHSLQLDETVSMYGSRLLGRPEVLSLVNNKHPMVPDVTYNGAFRLVLHGLTTEVMHRFLVLEKARAQSARLTEA